MKFSGVKRRRPVSDQQSEKDDSKDMDATKTQLHAAIAGIGAAAYSPLDRIDKLSLRRLAHQLADACKSDELVETAVHLGAVPAVVPLLTLGDGPDGSNSSFDDIKKEACFILGLLAAKPEYQAAIADAGALAGLVRLLCSHKPTAVTCVVPGSGGVARRAADAVTNLAHENVDIKNRVRAEGGIPPLVALLSAWDIKVQRAGAGALRTLAFKNEENKRLIVDAGALPLLVQMLRSEDAGVHYEAVGVIGNLVHSSQDIKRRVLAEGALQPVINLLSSTCAESQREAALLLGQFATADAAYKARIAQRGAVPPLVRMLHAPEAALREMAAFALGRLAQDSDNQASIVAAGGLAPLLELLEAPHVNLQHNAAFALYGLADCEDNVPDLLRASGMRRLAECGDKLQVQASKDCVHKTLTRVEAKLAQPRVLASCAYMLRSSDAAVQRAAASALARHMGNDPRSLMAVFVGQGALDVLLAVVSHPPPPPDAEEEEEDEEPMAGVATASKAGAAAAGPATAAAAAAAGAAEAAAAAATDGTAAEAEAETAAGVASAVLEGEAAIIDAASALLALANKVTASAPVDAITPAAPGRSVYLGEEHVNSPTLSDVTFTVEGRPFHAHRIALLASSDAFRAMFGGAYREREAASIDIPNIAYDVFEAMMRYIYTGRTAVPADKARELLMASDQYLLDGLKRAAEDALAAALAPDESLEAAAALAEDFSAPALARRCALFALEHAAALIARFGGDGYARLMRRMAPGLRAGLTHDLAVAAVEAAAAEEAATAAAAAAAAAGADADGDEAMAGAPAAGAAAAAAAGAPAAAVLPPDVLAFAEEQWRRVLDAAGAQQPQHPQQQPQGGRAGGRRHGAGRAQRR